MQNHGFPSFAAITRQTGSTPDRARLPNARLVIDHFHVVKLANDMARGSTAGDLRRPRAPWTQTGPRVGHPAAPAKRSRTTVGQIIAPRCATP
ncbi:transposase [Gordonia amicalis]|uniref:transposase n=1 Tax=Gordonia amicalis TaxID=89053 RepID=UPI0015F5A9ED|nr:transposase [Gordonia amicalis]MBA5846867.1 transposase [Gordonia amicalis]